MEFDSTGDLFGYPGRLSHSVESGAGRRRVFAVGNYVNQRLLRPLHNWLMEALGDLKTDGTFNQSAPLDRLVGAKKIYSIDLKAATDRWPLLIQLDLLKSLFGHEFADEVGNLLGFTMFGVPLAKSLERTNDSLGFSFQVGQPLGYYSSWAFFIISFSSFCCMGSSRTRVSWSIF